MSLSKVTNKDLKLGNLFFIASTSAQVGAPVTGAGPAGVGITKRPILSINSFNKDSKVSPKTAGSKLVPSVPKLIPSSEIWTTFPVEPLVSKILSSSFLNWIKEELV